MEYLIEIIKYIVLGIIQGITEIFPVSSSGHLVLFSTIFLGGANIQEDLTLFLIITNMGSFLALVQFYFKDIKELVTDTWIYLFDKEQRHNTDIRYNFYYVLKLLIAVIPIGIAGLLFKDFLPTNLLSVGISLCATSALLFLVFSLRNASFSNDLTWKNAGIIGLFQMFAILPGLSRSGITIVGGLSQKVSIKKVLRFSFLSYIIVSVPVSLLGLYEALQNTGTVDILGFVLAFIFSFIFSLLTVQFMSRFVQVKNLIWFSIYTLGIGILSIILYTLNV